MEIRSNIVDGFIAHCKRIEIDEEREKQERAKRYEIERRERMERYEVWKKSHPNCSSYSYCSEYNFETLSDYCGGYCKIYFYEWSDINREPLLFDYYAKFYKFLDASELFINAEQNSKIKALNTCYITCKPNSKEIVICSTYDGLSQCLADNDVEAKTASVTVVSKPPVVNHPTTSYNDYDEDDVDYGAYEKIYNEHKPSPSGCLRDPESNVILI